MTRSADLIQSNSQVYRIYSRRLSNPADPDIFITAARKLTTFLADSRAYYPEAQQPIIEILETARNSLKNVAPNVFSKPGGLLDRSAIPADKAPLFDVLEKLANSVTPYIHLFSDATLNNRLVSFLSSIGISLPGGATNVPPPDTPKPVIPSTRRQTDPTASQARLTSPIEIASPEVMTFSLPSTSEEATSEQPTTLTTSAPGHSGAVAQLTSNRLTTKSPVGSLRHPSPSRVPVSGDVVNVVRVEPKRDFPVPAPSLSMSSVSSSLRTGESSSPVSVPRVVPQSSQKIPDNASVTPSPASVKTSRGRNLQSMLPSIITTGQVMQVSQSLSVPTPQDKTPVQTSVSAPLVSTSSGQNEPKPPRKRQSSGLDFLQLDLQVARQKKLMAAKLVSGAQKPGSTTRASPGALPSPSTKDGPAIATASPTSPTTAGILDTPAARTSPPTVPAAAQAAPAHTARATDELTSAITSNLSDTTSQPQTPSSNLVYRDLRQGSTRVRTSGASPRKLRISDRAPAPAPEPGSSSAPIVIDEEESMSTPADEPIDVDVPMQARPQTEETPMALDPQNAQASNEDTSDNRKPQHDQERNASPEQQAPLHDKPSGSQLEPTKDHSKTMEESSTPSRDPTHTAVGVISAPKGKDREMTPPAPTTTASTAVATEASPALDHSTVPVVVVGPRSPGTVTLGVRLEEKKGGSETPIDRTVAVNRTPSISSDVASVSMSLAPSIAPHTRTESFSDMDISFSSDTPPIVVLGTRASSHSRSTSPQSGKRSSEAGTELVTAEEIEEDVSEMVDELAPLFGKEMKVICMDRAYDVPAEFSFDFTLSHSDWDRVSQWANAPENLDLDISQARCITLACYLMQELDPYATQDSLLRDQWFENVKPVPWANLPRNLWALINDEVTTVFPPYLSPDDLFDLSPFLRLGHNKISFTQIDGMAEYVLVLHGHLPTRSQLVPVKARWDQERRFREQLSLLSRPFIIDD